MSNKCLTPVSLDKSIDSNEKIANFINDKKLNDNSPCEKLINWTILSQLIKPYYRNCQNCLRKNKKLIIIE